MAPNPSSAGGRTFEDFLAASRRVPELNLPPRRSPFGGPSISAAQSEIDAAALLAREPGAVTGVLAAARETGAFQVTGVLPVEQVRAACSSAGLAFAVEQVKKKELGFWYPRRESVGEMFYWHRSAGAEAERALEAAVEPGSYGDLRAAMENVAGKLEFIAECIIEILSENIDSRPHLVLSRGSPSVLCFTQYNSSQMTAICEESAAADGDQISSFYLTLLVSDNDQEYYVNYPGGSTFLNLSAGTVLVTIGEQLEKWSKREFMSSEAEVIYGLNCESDSIISIEFLYSSFQQHLGIELASEEEFHSTLESEGDSFPFEVELPSEEEFHPSVEPHLEGDSFPDIELRPKLVPKQQKMITLQDQMVLALALIVTYWFCAWLSSTFSTLNRQL